MLIYTNMYNCCREKCLVRTVLVRSPVARTCFWVVLPRCLVGGYQRFGGTYFLHFQYLEDHNRTSDFRF
jgi:hypothetical protein